MDQNKFAESYSSWSDESLLRLALDADGLVAEANDALMAEIQVRRLSLQDFKKNYTDQQNRARAEKSLSRKRALCWSAGAIVGIFIVGALQGAIGLRLGVLPYMGIVAATGYFFQSWVCPSD